MNPEIKQNLKSTNAWLRGLNIVIFAVFFSVAEIILATVVIFQFLTTLFTGKQNSILLEFGANLCTYLYQVLQYLTYNSETKPFPFDKWPGTEKPLGDGTQSDRTDNASGNAIENH